MKIILTDINKLIKNNLKYIFMSAFIFSLIVTFVFFFLERDSGENNFLVEEDDTLEENTAVFRFYIENEDGTVFINSSLIEEYFILPEIIERAEEETSTDIAPVLEEEIGSEFEKSQYERGVLGVQRNGSTQIFKMNASIGSKSENLKITNFYFDLLNSEEIEFLQNKNIYIIEEPFIASEKIYDEEVYDSFNEFEEAEQTNESQNVMSYISTSFFAFILGGLVFLAFLIVKSFGKNLITYSFTYFKLPNDKLIRVNKSEEAAFFDMNLSEKIDKYLIVSQNNKQEYLKDFTVIDTLKNNEELIDGKDVVIRIIENETSKKWYRQQREILRKYPFNVTIIHLSD